MNKARMSAFTTSIKQYSGGPSHSQQARNKNKRHKYYKGKSKTVFTDDKIVYAENPKEIYKKLLELTNEFSYVTKYKVNNVRHKLYFCILATNNLKKYFKYHMQIHPKP